MKTKKFLCLVLSMVMALALAVPAFAANDDTTLAQGTEITGDTKVPTIKITVPDTGKVLLNPYSMTVKVKDGAIDASGTESTAQVIGAVQYVENLSDVAIKVSVGVTGAIADGSTMKLATAATNGTKPVTTKSAFMYFEILKVDNKTSAPVWGTAYDSKATNMIAVADKKTTTKADVVTLAAGTGSAAAAAGGYAAFRLAGDAAPAPIDPWIAADKVNVSIAFTFTPTVTPAASGN